MHKAIQPSDLKARPIPHAPATFDGQLSAYIAEWLDPLLCDAAEVAHLHHLLARYVQNPSATLLVRHVKEMTRGRTYRTRGGARLKATDNAPAWWWHSVLFNLRECVDWENLTSLIDDTPWHFHQMRKWRTINHSGWHAAHIFAAKDGDTDWRAWSRESAVRRFIRNIHPCNVFFVPKVEWRRVGGDPDLIAAVAAHYRQRHASVWTEFLGLAQGEPGLGDGAVDGPLVIGYPGTSGPSRNASTVDRRGFSLVNPKSGKPRNAYEDIALPSDGAITLLREPNASAADTGRRHYASLRDGMLVRDVRGVPAPYLRFFVYGGVIAVTGATRISNGAAL